MAMRRTVSWPPPNMPSWLSRNIELVTVRSPISMRMPAPLPSGTAKPRNTMPSTAEPRPRNTKAAFSSQVWFSKIAVPGWTALKVILPPVWTVHSR